MIRRIRRNIAHQHGPEYFCQKCLRPMRDCIC